MTFLGIEPNLRWRTYARAIMELAKEQGVKSVIHVGALLDAVPHTREVRLTGASTQQDLQKTLEDAGIRSFQLPRPYRH